MLLIFDLDDTLYPERSFVESGLHAVAEYLEHRFEWSRSESYAHMISTLDRCGRGEVFDALLRHRGAFSRTLVRRCLTVYREHRPRLSLYPDAVTLLRSLPQPLYLVTDGHKGVQERKIDSLGIRDMFKSYLTNRFGRHRAKPSTYCFERIRERERCEWSEMMYVGDNPAKDFVNLKPLGMHTVRVMTGGHRDVVAKPGYDAAYSIPDLSHLPSLIAGMAHAKRLSSDC